jgi:hypothetical protein
MAPVPRGLARSLWLRLNEVGWGVCMRKIIGLGLACVLAGCAAAPHQVRDRDDYLAEASRVYPRETRERVLKAAETVLRISDPADFEFRYTLSGFTGLRRYFIYAVIASASGREKWDFMTEPEPAGLRASVSISEEGPPAAAIPLIAMRMPWPAFRSIVSFGRASSTCSTSVPTGSPASKLLLNCRIRTRTPRPRLEVSAVQRATAAMRLRQINCRL